ncbi:Fanconi-associated nuclease [Mycena indigotica]|uniref:Fanconi-associated nuclease n=1 Tax=Mycena indigotica TaxID=2126181 RepID=A0A8H6WHI3_9AGAR|nr:Fanconi-associated nuclease [Mycena indigotica]KAF7315108.1 Fanconi-associated nuclease [Mycena indigotica]
MLSRSSAEKCWSSPKEKAHWQRGNLSRCVTPRHERSFATLSLMDDIRDTIQALIYGVDPADDAVEREEEESTVDGDLRWTKDSAYIAVLERAIKGIKELEGERRLFTDREWDFLDRIADLPYNARYMLIRLVLRKKPGGWYRVSDVRKYTMEIGTDGLREAFDMLAAPFTTESMELDPDTTQPSPPTQQEAPLSSVKVEPEIIDLTVDSDDEKPPAAGPSRIAPPPVTASSTATEDGNEINMEYFGRNEKHIGLVEGLRILNMEELKKIAKEMKIQSTNHTKYTLITALTNSASGQSLIPFAPSPKGKGKEKAGDKKLKQTILSFARPNISRVQTTRLKQLMLKYIDKAICLNPYIYALILRVHIIWFRSTEIPESLFSPALLAAFKKRTYAEYEHKRDPNIWPTRESYLEYEEMLNVERIVDELLIPEPKASRGKTAAPMEVFIPPGTPGLNYIRKLSTPARTPGLHQLSAPPDEGDDSREDDNSAYRKVNVILKLVKDKLLDQYQELVAASEDLANKRRTEFVRFESGYVLTRILAKCLHAPATLKDFLYEEEIILVLLKQRRWGRRRRARLYDRLALIRMRYLLKDGDGNKDMNVVRNARECLRSALEDQDTIEGPALLFWYWYIPSLTAFPVARPSLIHRLFATEKMLRLKPTERSTYDDVTLQKPPEIDVVGVRIWDLPDDEKENKPADSAGITNFFLPTRAAGPPSAIAQARKRAWVGKSYWQGKDDVVHVEILAIEHYAKEGFKGLHSETQILTTLFGLLFWDIIFAPVAGAFETPWQRGPLDLGEETFKYTREELIKARLSEIKQGKAAEILKSNDSRYREKKTCCVGVNWKMCSQEDLLEIVECVGKDVLASICGLFCEDYAGRSSGVPDLIIWNPETKEMKFVEVKGPGDTLHDNQKLWCHALLSAHCQVELCHVMEQPALERKRAKLAEKEAKAKTPKGQKRRASAPAAPSRRRRRSVEPESEEEGGESEADDDEAPWVPMGDLLPDGEPSPRRASKRQRQSAPDEQVNQEVI